MRAQAVCALDLDAFKARMTLLDHYKSNPQGLVSEIEQIRDKFKTDKNYQPTPSEQKLLDIPAFFDGMALYLSPEKHRDVFTEDGINVTQSDAEFISSFTAPEGQMGLKTAFLTVDQYTKEELASFLTSLGEKQEGRSDVAISFLASRHAVSANYLGNGKFEYIDTNSNVGGNMTHWIGDADGLAEQIFQSLADEKMIHLPLACELVIPANAPEIDFEACRNNKPVTELHADCYGSSVLDHASTCDDIRLIHRIDFESIAANQTQKQKYGPLLMAYHKRHIEIFNFLLTHSRPNEMALRLLLILMLAEQDFESIHAQLDHPNFKLSVNPPFLLHRLACDGSQDAISIVDRLLTKHGITANTEKGNYWSPFHIACFKNNLELAEVLLNGGANIDVQSNEGETALHGAAANGNMDIIELLIKKGADCNIKNQNGLTAFDEALKNGHIEIAEKLLAKTTLETQALGKHWSLQSLNCPFELKKEILKKGLADYIEQRGKEPEYTNIFQLGYSQKEKIHAARALLHHIDNPEKQLRPNHIKVLNNARLGNLYSQYQDSLNYEKRVCNNFKARIADNREPHTKNEPDNSSVNVPGLKL